MGKSVVEASTKIVVDLLGRERIRVLHVDDDSSFLKIAKQCLEMEGLFQVDAASSVDEAFDKLKKGSYDAVISDYQMPGKDGLEFLENLRANGNNVPFIMLTGKGKEEVAVKAWNLGADHYVNKNDDPEIVYCELAHCLRSSVEKHVAEARIRETAQKLQTIYQNALEGISYVNTEENFVYVNKAFADILGCREDQLAGMNLRKFVDDESWAKIKGETERRRQGEASRYELIFRRSDGTIRNVLVSGAPLFDRDGQFAGTVGIALDITEGKKVEEALRESEAKYRSLVEQSRQGIVVAQGPAPHLVFANVTMSKILGYTPEELASLAPQKIIALVHPHDRDLFFGRFKDRLEGKLVQSNCEVRGVRKDGTVVWVEVSSTRTEFNGEPAVQATFRDITERKRMEEEIANLAKFPAENPNPVLRLSQEGIILYANEASEKLLMEWRRKIGDYAPESWVGVTTEVIKAQADREVEIKTGKQIYSLLLTPAKNANYVNLYGTDITERKNAEEKIIESEEKWRSLVSMAPDGILTIDLKGVITSANDAFLRLTGCTKEEIVGKHFTKLQTIRIKDIPRYLKLVAPALSGKLPPPFEYPYVRKNGAVGWGEAHIGFLKKKGKTVGFQAILRETTERKQMEEALRESEEKHRKQFEEALDAIFLADAETGIILDCNRAAAELVRREKSELIGKHQRILHPPEKTEGKFSTTFKQHLKQKEGQVLETQVITRNGEIIDVAIKANVFELGDKKVLQGVFRDITERKKAEETIKRKLELEEALSKISSRFVDVQHIDSAISSALADMGRLCHASRSYLFLYNDDETMIDNAYEWYAPGVRPQISDLQKIPCKILPLWMKKLRKGETISIADVSKMPEETMAEKEILESQYIKSIMALPVMIGGKLAGFIGFDNVERTGEWHQDNVALLKTSVRIIGNGIERKKAECIVRESQEKFERLFMGTPEASVYLDTKFQIMDANPRFLKFFGYSIDEVRCKHINDVVVPENKIEEAQELDENAADGYVYRDTIRKKKDGSLVNVSVSAASLRVEGKPVGYVVVYKDISDLRKTQQQLGLMNEKLKVVDGLTRHDVRNKLAAVTGNVYLAKKTPTNGPKLTEYLDEIENAVQKTTKILDFARDYEMLGMEELTYIDVEKAVKEATKLFNDLRGTKIGNACRGLKVLADRLLRQVFYNLIDNTLRYSEKASQIRICYEEKDEHLKLVYEDDGGGIPANIKANLFTEGCGKGTGYGLFLIKKACDVYGWAIQETGTQGKGVRFVMTIPTRNQQGKPSYELP